MRASALHKGDRVEVDVKGTVFTATVEEAKPGAYVKLADPSPRWITWLFVSPRRVKRKVAVA